MTPSDAVSHDSHSSVPPEPLPSSGSNSGEPTAEDWNLGLGQVFGYIALGLLLGVSGSTFGVVVYNSLADVLEVTSEIAQQACGFLGLWLGLLAVPFYVLRQKGRRFTRELRLKASLPKDLFVGLMVGILGQFVLIPLIYLPLQILDPKLVEDVSAPAKELVAGASGLQMVVLFVIAGVLAPIVEEVFFRGFVFRALIERFAPWLAVLISSLVFGVYHFQYIQTVGLVAVGVVFAYLRLKTGRLGASIFAHIGFNSSTLIVLFATAS